MCDTPDKGQAHSTSDKSSGCDLLRSHICSEKLCVKISSEQGFPSQRDVGKDFSSIVSEACGGRDTASRYWRVSPILVALSDRQMIIVRPPDSQKESGGFFT